MSSRSILAYIPITNTQVLAINSINSEYVYSSFITNGMVDRVVKSKIQYDKHGKPYFSRLRRNYYIQDFYKG